MNIPFPQVERKSALFSYLLAAFAVFTLLMSSLSIIRMAELRLPVPVIDIHQAQTEKANLPVAIRAPIPPVEQVQLTVTPGPAGNTKSILVPQIVPVPAPSVP